MFHVKFHDHPISGYIYIIRIVNILKIDVE